MYVTEKELLELRQKLLTVEGLLLEIVLYGGQPVDIGGNGAYSYLVSPHDMNKARRYFGLSNPMDKLKLK